MSDLTERLVRAVDDALAEQGCPCPLNEAAITVAVLRELSASFPESSILANLADEIEATCPTTDTDRR